MSAKRCFGVNTLRQRLGHDSIEGIYLATEVLAGQVTQSVAVVVYWQQIDPVVELKKQIADNDQYSDSDTEHGEHIADDVKDDMG